MRQGKWSQLIFQLIFTFKQQPKANHFSVAAKHTQGSARLSCCLSVFLLSAPFKGAHDPKAYPGSVGFQYRTAVVHNYSASVLPPELSISDREIERQAYRSGLAVEHLVLSPPPVALRTSSQCFLWLMVSLSGSAFPPSLTVSLMSEGLCHVAQWHFVRSISQ